MEATTPDVTGRRIATIAASTVAGPVYGAIVLARLLAGEGPGLATLFLPLLVAFLFVGFCIAVLPVTIGVLLGGWLGARHPLWRHPLIWAGVGAALGATLVGWVTDAVMPVSSPWPPVATGIAVALVARRFVDWID